MKHFEFLVEDQSGGLALERLLPHVLEDKATFKIHSYKGLGHIPTKVKAMGKMTHNQCLLNKLPSLLRGYAKTPESGIVVVVCDLDDKNKEDFIAELTEISNSCVPKSQALFCLAVEELEAWYLGDLQAVRQAYPQAKNGILNGYKNDAICGTWELLADAIYKGGHQALLKKGGQEVGLQKCNWAKMITPYIQMKRNSSPSFKCFCSDLQKAIGS
jgi:hypothetical protein